MEKTSEEKASCTLGETLERLHLRYRTTFPVSLFRSKKSGQVLYLEAGKDFVDSLLGFLLLPLGTVYHMLSARIQVKPALGGMTGISSISESVENFSVSDLQVAKERLMRPRPAAIYTNGFVNANTTFIVTDNLEIMPLTTNKSVLVLSKLNVVSLADLEGHDIAVSLTQILQLLNSALTSNNCLTEVFGKSD